jgi:hypothetical protein
VGRHHWSGGTGGLRELYDLETDIGETTDVAGAHPGIVRDLEARIAACREDLGDATVGAAGSGCRPIGRAPSPRPLTTFDPACPYFSAMYDLDEMG